MGYPEMVVNSACRSGLFSSVGRRVFSSQATSLEDGSRCGAEVSNGNTVPVDALDFSLMMRLSPVGGGQTIVRKHRQLPCYAKAKVGARGWADHAGEDKTTRDRTRWRPHEPCRLIQRCPWVVNRFSVPTTLPLIVTGIRVSRSTLPVLASATVTRLTSRVRPTARS